jgi:hypothetical protein
MERASASSSRRRFSIASWSATAAGAAGRAVGLIAAWRAALQDAVKLSRAPPNAGFRVLELFYG